MKELTITVRSSEKKPNYTITAAELLKSCREFYQNPQNEEAFLEWKAGKEARHEKAV